MNSESVDLIYLDPPFNSNKNWSAPIGSEAAGAAFKDTWSLSDVDEAWHGEVADREPTVYAAIDAAGLTHGKGMKSYLIMMAVRLLEIRRLLKPTGSIYLHCDPTASHYLKTLMDAVFGQGNFRNEIMWCYRKWAVGGGQFVSGITTLFFSIPRETSRRSIFNMFRFPREPKSGGRTQAAGGFQGRNQVCRVNRTRCRKPMPGLVGNLRYKSQCQGTAPATPPKSLPCSERIVKASSNEGDMVLDPFCGCATALVAADRLQRQWVGIDLSPLAATLVLKRLRDGPRPAVRRCEASRGYSDANGPWAVAQLQDAQAYVVWPTRRRVRGVPRHVPVPKHDRGSRRAEIEGGKRSSRQPSASMPALANEGRAAPGGIYRQTQGRWDQRMREES